MIEWSFNEKAALPQKSIFRFVITHRLVAFAEFAGALLGRGPATTGETETKWILSINSVRCAREN